MNTSQDDIPQKPETPTPEAVKPAEAPMPQAPPPEAPPEAPTQFWDIKTERVPTDDPLLGCLVILTRLGDRPFSPESLTSGLPLVDSQLNPELFIRAAKRADLSAKVVKRSLRDISPLVLPVVLLLKNRQACLLVGFKRGRILKIIQPESGAGVKEVKIAQLEKEYFGYAIFTRPLFQFDQRTELDRFKRPKSWFWGVMWKIIPMYSEILIASLLINLFALGSPLYVMNVYDRVVPNKAVETLWVLAIGMMSVYFFDFLMKMLRGYFIDIAGKKADILLSSMIYEHMVGVNMEARPESVGSFMNNLSQFDSFRDFITSTTMTLLIDLPFIFIFIVVINFIGSNLILVPLVAIPVMIIVSFLIQIPLNKYVKESYQYAGQRQSVLVETLIGVETVKTSNAESPMQRRWENICGLASKLNIKIKILNSLATNFTAYSQQMAGIFIVILGVYNISAGEMTMGALIACNMLNGRTLAPLGQVASLITRYEQSMTSLNSVDKLMKMPVEKPPGKTPLYRNDFQGKLELNEVTFQYPNEEFPSIEKINFTIEPGEKVAIIGRIGSGKSTIAKLLLSLYQPQSGHVLIDGTEVQQLDPACIRRNIGYVPQDVLLFYGSVRDNIVLGAPYAEDTAILTAASLAGVTEFVSQHPKGFDMQVGERGMKLSGGQRQSVAIARGLLLDPDILVFDEPTNMMDTYTEEKFKYKLKQTLKDKTLVVITHKGSLLDLVDRIILIEDGHLIADGSTDAVIRALNEGKIPGIPGAASPPPPTSGSSVSQQPPSFGPGNFS